MERRILERIAQLLDPTTRESAPLKLSKRDSNFLSCNCYYGIVWYDSIFHIPMNDTAGCAEADTEYSGVMASFASPQESVSVEES